MTKQELLDILQEQHTAIDICMALLITNKVQYNGAEFLPTKSGRIWNAVVLGNEAIMRLQVGEEITK